jgi:uncharacterized protein YjbI with pentapeptide repeats
LLFRITKRFLTWLFGGLLIVVEDVFLWIVGLGAWVVRGLRRFLDWWTVRRAGVLMLFVAVIIAVTGYAREHPGDVSFRAFVGDFYANASTELASIAITVLIIDALNYRREKQDQKTRLLGEVRNRDNGLALRALEEMRAFGWIMDGTLAQANLWGANLEEADLNEVVLRGAQMGRANLRSAVLFDADLREVDLSRAVLDGADMSRADLRRVDLSGATLLGVKADWINLHMADLSRANLAGASLNWASLQRADLNMTNLQDTSLRKANLTGVRFLSDAQLYRARRLRGAVMPDGTRYNGRYNLVGDLDDAREHDIDVDDPAVMARWYRVSEDSYRQGQAWHASVPHKLLERPYEPQVESAFSGDGPDGDGQMPTLPVRPAGSGYAEAYPTAHDAVEPPV